MQAKLERFVHHPAVRPSILAKQNAAVYDFLIDSCKTACEACVILDLPGKDEKKAAEYFCYRLRDEGNRNIHFSFGGVADIPRIILKGNASDVLRLMNGYAQEQSIH